HERGRGPTERQTDGDRVPRALGRAPCAARIRIALAASATPSAELRAPDVSVSGSRPARVPMSDPKRGAGDESSAAQERRSTAEESLSLDRHPRLFPVADQSARGAAAGCDLVDLCAGVAGAGRRRQTTRPSAGTSALIVSAV